MPKFSCEVAFFDERLKTEEERVKKTCQTMSTSNCLISEPSNSENRYCFLWISVSAFKWAAAASAELLANAQFNEHIPLFKTLLGKCLEINLNLQR